MKKILGLCLIVGLGFSLGGCGKSGNSGDFAYVQECQKLVEQKVTNPSTLDFGLYTAQVKHAKNGNVVVMANFSAKNTFGVKGEHKARCLFGGNDLNEVSII